MEEKFNRLYSLVQKHEESYQNHKRAVNTDNRDQMIAAERMSDKIYSIFFEIIHSEFEKDLLEKVNLEIGNDKFITMEYVDTLKKVYEEMPRVLDKYKGYVLKSAVSCWGDVSAFVYVDGRQYSEAIDIVSEEQLIYAFRTLIDQSSNSPDFSEL